MLKIFGNCIGRDDNDDDDEFLKIFIVIEMILMIFHCYFSESTGYMDSENKDDLDSDDDDE